MIVFFILAIVLAIIIRGYDGLTTGFKCIRDQFPFEVLLCSKISVTAYLCKNAYLIVGKVELWDGLTVLIGVFVPAADLLEFGHPRIRESSKFSCHFGHEEMLIVREGREDAFLVYQVVDLGLCENS